MPRKKDSHVNETIKMKNGQMATIIVYRNYLDIDVKFEDGAVVEHRNYGNFKKGIIKNPNIIGKNDLHVNRIGMQKIMSNGQKAKIIVYKNNSNVDVQFEDGTIVRNKQFYNFEKGLIKNPNINKRKKKEEKKEVVLPKNKVGETRTMSNGQTAKIIAYRVCSDIDVRFEDGTIMTGKRYSNFVKGKIRNPNFEPELFASTHIGEAFVMANGQIAVLVSYKNPQCVSIQFEDGTVVTKIKYKDFINGNVENPNCR